jgi:CheY-like chemotaxis protein
VSGQAGAAWARVLVVDDDPDVQTLVALALAQAGGYTVEPCASAAGALERARSFRPDVILMDVMMPGMDGLQALAGLRADEGTAGIPVVLISAGIDRDECGRYREMGARGVIPKPFNAVELPATLRRIREGEAVAPAYPREVKDLGSVYLTELPAMMDSMRALAAALAAGGWAKPPLEALLQLAHRLAGSAGLYGLAGLASSAATLETMTRRLLEDGRWPPARSPRVVATLVKAVAAAAPRAARRGRTDPARPSR